MTGPLSRRTVVGVLLMVGPLSSRAVSSSGVGDARTTDKGSVDVLLVAGQSNATSAGTLGAGDAPPYMAHPDPLTQIFDRRTGQLAPYVVGTNSHVDDPGDAKHWGPEAEFAHRNRQGGNTRPLCIVKRTLGATYLAAGQDAQGRPDWSPMSASGLYGQLRADWFAVRSLLVAQGRVPKVRGLIWMQGENDGSQLATATAYLANLRTFFARLRQEFELPNLRLAIGQISPSKDWRYGRLVRQAQATFVAEDGNAVLLDMDAFALTSDGAHWLAPGIIDMGRQAYQALATAQ